MNKKRDVERPRPAQHPLEETILPVAIFLSERTEFVVVSGAIELPRVGLPIMRQDFVTTTGLLYR